MDWQSFLVAEGVFLLVWLGARVIAPSTGRDFTRMTGRSIFAKSKALLGMWWGSVMALLCLLIMVFSPMAQLAVGIVVWAVLFLGARSLRNRWAAREPEMVDGVEPLWSKRRLAAYTTVETGILVGIGVLAFTLRLVL